MIRNKIIVFSVGNKISTLRGGNVIKKQWKEKTVTIGSYGLKSVSLGNKFDPDRLTDFYCD